MIESLRINERRHSEQQGARVRTGGPGRAPQEPRQRISKPENPSLPTMMGAGSHMPLDHLIHWSWRNPLNILPLLIVLALLLALASLAIQALM